MKIERSCESFREIGSEPSPAVRADGCCHGEPEHRKNELTALTSRLGDFCGVAFKMALVHKLKTYAGHPHCRWISIRLGPGQTRPRHQCPPSTRPAQRARQGARALALCSVFVLVGCAATTSTRETTNGYAIFEIRAARCVTHARLTDAVRVALQKNTSQVRVHQGIAPAKLPDTPQRFQLMSPFKGSCLAAVAAESGQAVEVPTCDGAIVTATARDTSMGRYGQATSFFVCVLAHQGGWTLNIHTQFSKVSGAFNAGTPGVTLVRTVVGDSPQFIPRTIDALADGIKVTGAPATISKSYP